MVLEKTLESPQDCKEIRVNPKENKFWTFFGRTDAKAEVPVLWPPDAKSRLITDLLEKILMFRKIEQEEKGMTEHETVG